MSNREVIQCTRCILDNIDDPYITFDDKGVCNHCRNYDKVAAERLFTGEEAKQKLNAIIERIKEDGKGKPYDTILGVSGGVDSTYLAYLGKQFGLRILLFHFDNGWNSEIAVKNIENMSRKLGYDLETYVVDWEEFRDVQLSYIKANVVDIEAITDHCAKVATRRLAKKYGIKNVIIGTNIATELILPDYWIFPKNDNRNLVDIHKKFGKVKLKTLPVSTNLENFLGRTLYDIAFHSILDYVPYNKSEVKEIIKKELGWIDYGGKHYESIWTRFYQGYLLPQKFNIDKRKAHLSNLICSGQITKEEALKEMEQPIYDPEQLKTDMQFVLKKLQMTEEEFKDYLKQPRREHREFDHMVPIEQRYPILKPFKYIFRKIVPVIK